MEWEKIFADDISENIWIYKKLPLLNNNMKMQLKNGNRLE